MAARNYNNQQINSTDWDNAVDSTSLPLTNTGNAKVTFNSTTNRWEFYIGGVLIMSVDANGRLRLKDQVVTGEAEPL